jgi:hypothetical protein
VKRFLNFALAVVASTWLLSPLSLLAQYGERRQPQPEIQRENLQCSGTVKQVGRGVIGVVTDAGDQWVFQLEARPQDLSFTGSADATFVKPGMWIRFTTKLTRRGDAQEPIASAEVYTPREGFGVGVYPEGAGEIGGGEGGGPLFAPAEEKPKPKAKAEPKIRDEDVVYRVGGQVSKISRLGELTISAGGSSVKAKLADDAKISIDVTDLSFLQAGDKVEVRGWYPAGTKGRAIANQVTASASQPLTDASKKKKPVPTADKPAAEAGEAKADKPADGDKKPGENKAEEKKADEKPAAEKKAE